MQSLDEFATGKLAALEEQTLRRRLVETLRTGGAATVRRGRTLISFCCNDYLNLSQHPAVIAAAVAAVREHGVGSGASRLITGNHPLFAKLEGRLAGLKGSEDCCVFGSGYLANTGIIPALVGPEDLIVLDELSHACLWSGARLSRATILPFRHNDVAHARALLAEHRRRHPHALIATDGVFSMDGDLAPLPALSRLAQDHNAWLMTDDAHGLGVIGGGRGSAFAHGAPVEVPLHMGTLSKAVGTYGGYLCASHAVCELMRNRARTLVYSTGLPPAIVAAAIAALDVIENEPAYAARPLHKAKAFTRSLGLPEAESPIVPVILGSAERAITAARLLEEEGFLVAPIRPPTVPEGTARLRFTFSAEQPDAAVERLANVVRDNIMAAAS
ncbi:MAG: aminotransferase class I/II-fold pyridoxal phosphate-dependent enzyme [Rhizobiales bacterium]|nr:aminotransferase class I/II-fold pyridoxal phosphate-dependent enzyme [Hyphomicrobiales bacterium]